ncbi:DinB family protein [Jeotgalibacillus soli]|uniref:DinB-like domain-containing protein n=1 Tax=Jeotgalibacillus soli TaxID=889306 RepID=A0A0C2RQK4_9BACL|nr:DinB family protein [Jeotgalibacillus soli]KIL52525.1 hypothetical protein KP78_00600 [Jeotgalibacillus soli]
MIILKVTWLSHCEQYLSWLLELKEMEDYVWFAPIEEGKWSTAAIISHLQAWDAYTINERLSFMKEGALLENFPDFQEFNEKARTEAHNGQSKEMLIDLAYITRVDLMNLISDLADETLSASFSIGDHSLTIEEYLRDFMEHDLHHQEQIEMMKKSL